jgi:response regulator RpfG family c-di-GMP phosphodiesterase
MRGKEIYDLAKIVAIANTFDELVSSDSGPLADRQKNAIAQLEGPLAHKFDPMKLQKALKVLTLGV